MADALLPKTKAAARLAGSATYFTGKPCPQGHMCPRSVHNGDCVECHHAATAKWARANAATKNALNAKWAAENSGKISVQQRRWYLANVERLKAKAKVQSARWRKENPDKHAAKERNRRARKRAAEGSHTAGDIAAIRKMQKDRCAVCRVKLLGTGDVDHIQPLLRGGSNNRSNLQLLCGPCNGSKGPKDPIEFMQSLGRLL